MDTLRDDGARKVLLGHDHGRRGRRGDAGRRRRRRVRDAAVAVFEYRGIQVATGKPVKGVRDAENAKALRARPAQATASCSRSRPRRTSSSRRRPRSNIDLLRVLAAAVAPADVAVMTRQLATLVRAGIPLVESLAALIEQVENEQLVRALTQCASRSERRHELREGARGAPEGLPAALREHGRAPARPRARSRRCSSASPTSWRRRRGSRARSRRRSPTRC